MIEEKGQGPGRMESLTARDLPFGRRLRRGDLSVITLNGRIEHIRIIVTRTSQPLLTLIYTQIEFKFETTTLQ